MNNDETIPVAYRGWWRIVETSQWATKYLDSLGTALLSVRGTDDRLRMHCLLAYVTHRATKSGVSFTWHGAWEYDQVSGSGRVVLAKDGRLKGTLRIARGDSSTFIAIPSAKPSVPIAAPPSYQEKWSRR